MHLKTMHMFDDVDNQPVGFNPLVNEENCCNQKEDRYSGTDCKLCLVSARTTQNRFKKKERKKNCSNPEVHPEV